MNPNKLLFSECIRSHIIQWAHEKNRRLKDGYDFEVCQLHLVDINFLHSHNSSQCNSLKRAVDIIFKMGLLQCMHSHVTLSIEKLEVKNKCDHR